ncbi:MAG: hypothetical protein VR70_11085 [Rhodospirillaceae bacterium BRH_c57]|nr:MAG: hypothetical protein VR70_11085 [Rhodospirillaceae bacterium BRH_c57]
MSLRATVGQQAMALSINPTGRESPSAPRSGTTHKTRKRASISVRLRFTGVGVLPASEKSHPTRSHTLASRFFASCFEHPRAEAASDIVKGAIPANSMPSPFCQFL